MGIVSLPVLMALRAQRSWAADKTPRRPRGSWPRLSSASPWRRQLDQKDIRAPAKLARLDYVALSGWFGDDTQHWKGGADCAVHIADASDPLVSVWFHPENWDALSRGDWRHSGNSTEVEAEIRKGITDSFEGYEINPYSSAAPFGFSQPQGAKRRTEGFWSTRAHVPANALPAKNPDSHMAVLQPNGWVLETLATICLANGDIVCGFASYTDPTGVGDGRSGGRRASLVPNYAGILLDHELNTGDIRHAIALAAGPEILAREILYPALALDRDPDDYAGNLPMGCLLAIPEKIDLKEIGFKTMAGFAIAVAAQRHGCYVVDRASPGCLIFCTETAAFDGTPYSGEMADDLKQVRNLLHMVSPPQPA